MTWNDYYRRRDIIDAALRQARRDPAGRLPFAEIPGAEDEFGSEQNLLLALQYKWTQRLAGYLRTEVIDDTDHVDAVTRAWHRASVENRTLRTVLDANADRYPALCSAHEAEQRMLAVTAGLADASEPATEITKVGAAFEALLRHGPQIQPARNAVGQLLRMLAPSA